jgi:polyadenylate-binding protein
MAAQQQNASLYTGELHPDVTEATLFEVFKAVGPLMSIRVCRDAVTRRSLGYAYVNFQNPTDAERALETLNYHRIKEKPIRLMWLHRDPSLRKSGSGNVFIKNLHPDIDHQTLYDTFSQFGNILSCKVSTDMSTGKSRGYGFVHFESEESATVAIEKVDGMLLKDKQVYVAAFVRRSQRIAQSQAEFTNCYIKNVKDGVTEEDVTAYFKKFGEVASVAVKVSKERPFAFCDFKEHASAVKACEEAHDIHVASLCGDDAEAKLYCQRAQRKSERAEELNKKFQQQKMKRINENLGQNLYVKNLDDNVGDKELREAFERFGDIISARVMLDEKKPPQSKGFGFISFKDLESANRAIAEMNGFVMGSKPLYVNIAQRKEARRAALEMHFQSSRGAGPSGQPGFPAFPGAGMPGYGQPSPYPGAPPNFFFPPGRGGMPPRGWPQQPGMFGPFGPAGPLGGRGAPRRTMGRGLAVPAAGGRGGGGRGLPKPGLPPQPGMQGMVYNKQARNRDPYLAAAAGGAGFAGSAGVGGQVLSSPDQPLTAAMLANMTMEQQKNTLGERLYQEIIKTAPDSAAKITGMLLEMDIAEQLNLIEDPTMLQEKISEALQLLKLNKDE